MLVVVGIVIVLVGVLLPVFNSGKVRAVSTACLSGLRQQSAALSLYAADHDDYFPQPETALYGPLALGTGREYTSATTIYRDLLMPYGFQTNCTVPGEVRSTWRQEHCLNALASDSKNLQGFKLYEIHGRSRQAFQFPAKTIEGFECRAGLVAIDFPDDTRWPIRPGPPDLAYLWMGRAPKATAYFGGSNYVFMDGHGKWLRPEKVRAEHLFDPTGEFSGLTPPE
ncbi:MAG: hypothetical protein MH204_09990 [Fimbriimonadaceae bacterium]|nr:hypothetical protein [Fimbriimonadaceae bacterium]